MGISIWWSFFNAFDCALLFTIHTTQRIALITIEKKYNRSILFFFYNREYILPINAIIIETLAKVMFAFSGFSPWAKKYRYFDHNLKPAWIMTPPNMPVIKTAIAKIDNVSIFVRPIIDFYTMLLSKIAIYCIPKGYLCFFRSAIKDAPKSKPRLIKSTTLSPTKERIDIELDRTETIILRTKRIYV